jgi:hypothetical protein
MIRFLVSICAFLANGIGRTATINKSDSKNLLQTHAQKRLQLLTDDARLRRFTGAAFISPLEFPNTESYPLRSLVLVDNSPDQFDADMTRTQFFHSSCCRFTPTISRY